MLTIESNVAQIESIFITIESILSTIESVFSIESVYHNRVGFYYNRVDSCHNRVDSCHNRVDSGAAHNTIFGSTILKQTACHTFTMKTGACLHTAAVNWVIVGVNYIISYQKRLLWRQEFASWVFVMTHNTIYFT